MAICPLCNNIERSTDGTQCGCWGPRRNTHASKVWYWVCRFGRKIKYHCQLARLRFKLKFCC